MLELIGFAIGIIIGLVIVKLMIFIIDLIIWKITYAKMDKDSEWYKFKEDMKPNIFDL